MNTQTQAVMPKARKDAPLFASTWVALYVLLRRELTQPRNGQ